jgi:hypothetical protein
MAKAAELGFKLSKPWGDSAPYDVGVEHGGHYIRVQVKSTISRDRTVWEQYKEKVYSIKVRRTAGKRYRRSDFDFLAVYVVPEDLWYIIPAKVALQLKWMRLNPANKRNRRAQYKEAWHLLRDFGKIARPTINLQAAADPFFFHELTPEWEGHNPPDFGKPQDEFDLQPENRDMYQDMPSGIPPDLQHQIRRQAVTAESYLKVLA